MRGNVAIVVAALVAGGCGQETPSVIDVVVVEVPPGLPERPDELRLEVTRLGDDGTESELLSTVTGPRYVDGMLQPWITSTSPRRPGDAGRVLHRFRASAIRAGREMVSAQHRVVFVPGGRLTLPIRLDASCVGRVCPDDQTCADGACRDDLMSACELEVGPPSPFCREEPGGLDAAPLTDASAGARDGSTDATHDGGGRDAAPADADCTTGGECEPGATGACGDCGTRTCTEACAWGPCNGEGVCSPDATDGCGDCGTRTCTEACAWGPCTDEGVCSPGATLRCGNCDLGRRTCSDECSWGGCVGGGECMPGDMLPEVTGFCSPPCMRYAYVPTCDASCTWRDVYSMRCMGGC